MQLQSHRLTHANAHADGRRMRRDLKHLYKDTNLHTSVRSHCPLHSSILRQKQRRKHENKSISGKINNSNIYYSRIKYGQKVNISDSDVNMFASAVCALR